MDKFQVLRLITPQNLESKEELSDSLGNIFCVYCKTICAEYERKDEEM